LHRLKKIPQRFALRRKFEGEEYRKQNSEFRNYSERCRAKAGCDMSRRDDPIVAWHDAPGKASLERAVP
jgi:hypothetical protein